MAIRYYSSTAIQTTLTASITPSSTTIQVAATTGFPGSTPYTLSLDYGAANEELVDVTAVAGFSLTVTRNVDGTPASSHNAGAIVRHVTSARDFTEFQQHINGSTNVHGLAVGSAVVGTTDTQTLTNKTLTKATGSLLNVDLFNTGAGNVTSVIGDSANPTANRMNWLKDEISLTPLITFGAAGGMILAKSTTDGDGTYKVRLVEDVGGTDRAALLAGGTLALTPTTTTGFLPVDIGVPDASTTKRTIRVSDPGGTNERFATFNDGHTIINNLTAGAVGLNIKGAASQSTDFLRVQDSASKRLMSVASSGRLIAGESLDTGNTTGTAATVPLRVFANTTSQTGDLQQWIDQFGLIQSRIDSTGRFHSSPFSNTGTGVVTASAGWSITSAVGIIKSDIATIALGMQRTGAAISADAVGNTPDTPIATLTAPFMPSTLFGGQTMSAAAQDGVGNGCVRLSPSTGVFDVVSWSTNGAISTSATVRITISFPVD